MRRALVAIVLALAAPAGAAPDDIVGRSLVLAPDQLAAAVTLEINDAPGYVAEPTSLAPDLWYGVAPGWTIGLIHSDPSVDRFEVGASLCVRKGLLECDETYHGGGLEARWLARDGALQVAPVARLRVRELSPFEPAVTLGAMLRWQRGRFAVTGDPYLQIGLANTDRGNASALVLPVTFSIQPTCRWALSLSSGWNAELATWRDGYRIPVAVGTVVRVTTHVDVGATLGFAELLGPQNSPKPRAVFVMAGYRS